MNYGAFNDTKKGREAKLLLEHGDITALSIYANKLQQAGANVLHGAIQGQKTESCKTKLLMVRAER